MPWALPLLVRSPADRLRYRKDIASVIPLHICFQVQLDLSLVVCSTTYTSECRFTATRTELFVHVFGGEEAAMTPQNCLFQMCNPFAGGRREQVQVNLKQDILHGKIPRHCCYL